MVLLDNVVVKVALAAIMAFGFAITIGGWNAEIEAEMGEPHGLYRWGHRG